MLEAYDNLGKQHHSLMKRRSLVNCSALRGEKEPQLLLLLLVSECAL